MTASEVFARLKTRVAVEGSCWIYPQRGRYGRTKLHGKTVSIHRIAWMAHNEQEIPTALQVCHACDRPMCINPDHLWLGTTQDNTADKVQKRRQARGETVSRKYSPLLAVDVMEIRELYASGVPPRIIKRLYPVGKSNLFNIVNRRWWTHVA